MVTYPILYGTASTGKTKVWSIAVDDLPAESQIIIHHGEENGKQQQTIRRIKAGKNVGRSNETTVSEQARLEAESFWKKKQDKGYTRNRGSVGRPTKAVSTSLLPMLALKYEDRKHKLVWPVYVQPKLNGVRCLIQRTGNTITFHSRGNKRFTTLAHLEQDCLAVMEDGGILDGELYHHGEVTFQELISLIKNGKNTDADKVRKYVQFHNYDVISDKPFSYRQSCLRSHGAIKSVPTMVALNETEVMMIHQKFVKQEYEGSMVRSGGAEPYVFQYRSTSLLKLKPFQDMECEIVGAKEGVGKDVGKATFRCRMPSGEEFDVRCKGADEVRQEQWRNRTQYVGKHLTVQYQYLSDDGIPIFPVGLAVRDYE